uniref:DNA replication complex GINS protein SLD5 n=1 Tax=Meloidogyne javanica TaxID=6303 RepID=A0A915N9J1_MELJA
MSNEFDENIPSTSSATFLQNNDVIENNVLESDEAEGSEEYLTPADATRLEPDVLKELTQAFLNESASPKLLPEKLDLVDKMLLQKNLIERIMERNPNKKSLACSLHKMELCRIEYLINSYLRLRLQKIEQNPAQSLQDHSERLKNALAKYKAGNVDSSLQAELLDVRELKFAQKLLQANSTLFEDSFLKQIPASMKWLPIVSNNSETDSTRVFIEVLKDGSTNSIIHSSRPAPFPLLTQPKTTTRSSSVQSSIPSSIGQQQKRLISLRQPSGNEKIKRNRMQHFEFIWIAPEHSRYGTDQLIIPIHGRLDVGKLGKQARLELTGTPPFRSNFVSILDFQTNRVAIMDMSLRSGNSQQQKQQNRHMLVCFVVDLDRQGDLDDLLKSAKIGECKDARWVYLSKINGDQKNQKCSECFDFCLPDWGIQKDVVRDENYLNILRQICFSLFIPEWRPFAQQAPLGGQQRGQTIDLYSQQQPNINKIDETSKANTLNSGPTETKWISLQTQRIVDLFNQQQKKRNGEQRHSFDEHCLLLPRLVEDEHCFVVVVDDGGGGEDCLLDALLTDDPPTTTTTTTTTKAATSTTQKKEAPQKGMFANALSGLENLAGRDDRTWEELTPEEKAAGQAFLVSMLIGLCCCFACCIGIVVLLVKVLSK